MACDLAGHGADYSAMAYLTCPAWTENGLIGRRRPLQDERPWSDGELVLRPYGVRLTPSASSYAIRRYAEGVTPMSALNAAVNFDGLP